MGNLTSKETVLREGRGVGNAAENTSATFLSWSPEYYRIASNRLQWIRTPEQLSQIPSVDPAIERILQRKHLF